MTATVIPVRLGERSYEVRYIGKAADIAAALVGAGLRLETIMPTQRLEDAFLDLLAANETEVPA